MIQRANPWARYGQRTAAAILSALRGVPGPSQSVVLRAMLEPIDPDLYTTIKARSDQAVRAGVPVTRALETAIASSMTEGALSELVEIGRRRDMPPARSLIGLGIYGGTRRRALGDSWTTTASGGAGTGVITPIQPPIVVEGQATGGQVSLIRLLQIGPFVMEDRVGASIRVTPATTTPEITKQTAETIQRVSANIGLTEPVVGSGGGSVSYRPLAKNPFRDMFGLDAKAYVLADVVNGLSPVWKFKHPITGLYYALKISSIGNTENPGYTVTYHDNNSFIGNLLEKLDELHAKILEILKALADKLGDIACSTLNTPGGAAAATAAAGPYGAAGAMAAAALCKPGALPPPPPPSGGGYLLPLAIGGGLLLIVAAVARRR